MVLFGRLLFGGDCHKWTEYQEADHLFGDPFFILGGVAIQFGHP